MLFDDICVVSFFPLLVLSVVVEVLAVGRDGCGVGQRPAEQQDVGFGLVGHVVDPTGTGKVRFFI